MVANCRIQIRAYNRDGSIRMFALIAVLIDPGIRSVVPSDSQLYLENQFASLSSALFNTYLQLNKRLKQVYIKH